MDLDHLPIVPHKPADGSDCCGCLMVQVRGEAATILCNECSAVIEMVPVGEVEATMLKLSETDVFCSAQCSHCGAHRIFPGMSAILMFICSECGGVSEVERPVQ